MTGAVVVVVDILGSSRAQDRAWNDPDTPLRKSPTRRRERPSQEECLGRSSTSPKTDHRDDVRTKIIEVLSSTIRRKTNPAGTEIRSRSTVPTTTTILEEYVYTRPIIGAPSTTKTKNTASSKSTTTNTSKKKEPSDLVVEHDAGETTTTTTKTTTTPCGPLLLAGVAPKVLIVGETASAVPSPRTDLMYCERSMWIVFGSMFDVRYNSPIKNVRDASDDTVDKFLALRRAVLLQGFCIWDVLADVHPTTSTPTTSGTKNKRRRKGHASKTPNDVTSFLQEHPSVKAIAFIGKKASATFRSCVQENDELATILERVATVILPSSSPSNSRMTIDEKASEWKKILNTFITTGT